MMNEEEKFRLEEHENEQRETINSAPKEVRELYQEFVTQMNKIGINSSRKRANFLTFWLGVELQKMFSNVLSGELREGKYFQYVCSTIENLLKYSFKDTLPITWALSSVLKEISEETMRYNRQTMNHK